nr:vicilin-like seed storage protein At2g18540 [Labrus bergylta]
MVEDNGRGEESLETDRKASVDETQRKAEGKENQRRRRRRKRREEAARQAAARRRKAQRKAKGITKEIKVEGTDGEADTYETQKKRKRITSESKGGEQQLMLQHSDMNKEMRERGVEGQEDLQQEEDMETYQPQPNVIRVEPFNTTFHYESAAEGQSKEAFGRGQKEVQTQNINTDQKMEETTTEINQRKRKSLREKEALEQEDSKRRKV